jgi:hypothetical protein
MTRPFWFAAGSGVLLGAAVIYNQTNRTDARIILVILMWALFVLSVIDTVRTR